MRDPKGFVWDCCEGSVKDPGCEAADTYQHENDLELERHTRYENMSDHDDIYSVDSMDWCERHCGCGYADHVNAYCLTTSRSLMESYPRGFHSDNDERSSDEADSENNSGCSEIQLLRVRSERKENKSPTPAMIMKTMARTAALEVSAQADLLRNEQKQRKTRSTMMKATANMNSGPIRNHPHQTRLNA
jgi:hypothetical protein